MAAQLASGYISSSTSGFLVDLVITLNCFNPQIASRQLVPLTRWHKYDSARQQLMRGELSSDVYEVVSKSLV